MLAETQSAWEAAVPLVPWGIGILTVAGLILQVAAWKSYHVEIKFTERLREKIHDLLSSSDEGTMSAEELLDEEQIPQDSLVATRTMELEKFAQYPGMVALHDLGAVAAEADAGRIRNALPNVLIASLLVCGLFGTLLSLKVTLPKANISKERMIEMRASELGPTAEYADNLKEVTQGFGEAFLASIFGVGGTILLIAGRVFVRERRECCFGGIERFVVESLLPYYIQPEKTQLQRAAGELDSAHNRFDGINDRMADSADAIQAAITHLKEVLDQSNETFGDGGPVAKGLTEFSRQTKVYNENSKQLVENQIKGSKALATLTDRSRELIEKLEKKAEEDEENRSKAAKEMEGLVAVLTEGNNKVRDDFVQAVGDLKEAQGEVITAMSENSTAQLEAGKKQEQTLASAITNMLEDLRKRNDELVGELSKSYNDQLASASKTNEELMKSLRVLSDRLEQVALKEDRVDIDAFNEFRNHLSGVDTKLQESILAQKAAVEEVRTNHQKMDQKMLKSFEEFSGRIKTLSRVIDKIAEAGSIEHETMVGRIKKAIMGKGKSKGEDGA